MTETARAMAKISRLGYPSPCIDEDIGQDDEEECDQGYLQYEGADAVNPLDQLALRLDGRGGGRDGGQAGLGACGGDLGQGVAAYDHHALQEAAAIGCICGQVV